MKQIRRSALVAASPERMFALINDVARYPEFVPGCTAAQVLEQGAVQHFREVDVMASRLGDQRSLHPQVDGLQA